MLSEEVHLSFTKGKILTVGLVLVMVGQMLQQASRG